jgi:sugar lactone lactonase YvrE
MTKQLVTWVLFSLIGIPVHAQKLTQLWVTDSVLKVPESVYFDAKYQRLYVSNIDGKGPWDKDSKGSIAIVTLSGKVLNPEWVKGFHAPKGMTMFQDFLIVADIDSIAIIDVVKGMVLKKVYVEGAQALNDITSDKRGNMYVSDSKNKKIFYIDAMKLEPKLFLDGLNGPNGVCYSERTFYFLDAGSLYRLGKDKEKILIASGMDGNTDGLEQWDEDSFIVSCWEGMVWHVKMNGEKTQLLDTRAQGINAADIGIDKKTGTIYVPAFWKNYITAYQIKP